MDYEQKYKEALNKAQRLSIDGFLDAVAISDIFPELKENEDEKIRKAIIRILKGETGYTSKEDTDKYVAWLEKQGELKKCDEESDEEWKDTTLKFVINRVRNTINKSAFGDSYEFLSFHTQEQRDLFLEENEDLIKDYLMID